MKKYKRLNAGTASKIAKGLNDVIRFLDKGESFTNGDLRSLLEMNKTPYRCWIPTVFCNEAGNEIIRPSDDGIITRKTNGGEFRFKTFVFSTNHVTTEMIQSLIVKMNDGGMLRLITDIQQLQPKVYEQNAVLVQNGDGDVDISKVADGILIAELRSRGIDVVATKKVEVVTTKTITY